MSLVALILVGLLGIEHLGIAGLEMLAKPDVQAGAFGMPLSFVQEPNAQVALKNQGIYNFALGLVLLLTLVLLHGQAQVVTAALLAGFVALVGLYGGATVTKKIFLLQALPGVVTLILVVL
ncbi:DUF1304 domain-containing protein [Lacticaseibacillus mingshuiensis]|uniref:DUF1304 domain-containing protein n=1 Tax=Lacticaseibacillus mingshuiensis TaxID=2799574 RepID=A0ABW4CH44_9LACO|nr:DUF1304 domain-containing protein [Lacticaseibacillus mingshuiensis]